MNLNIVVSSDENYVAHMATLIASICENNNENEIIVHIFDGGITDTSKNKLELLKNEYSFLKIIFYVFTDEEIRNRLGKNLNRTRSLSTYSRIFIPDIIDKSIDRAVYFDVDAICCGDISELFKLEMGSYLIAGVQDCNFRRAKTGVGLSEDSVYINAGMILWNLPLCREEKVVEKFIDFVRAKHGNVPAMDQGTINGVLSSRTMLLDPRWNCITPFFQMSCVDIKKMYNMDEYYSEDSLKKAVSAPRFVHFVPNLTTRPWIENCKHPLKDEYWKYRNMTPFSNGNNLLKDTRAYKAKLMSILFYSVPRPLFLRIFSVINNRKEDVYE